MSTFDLVVSAVIAGVVAMVARVIADMIAAELQGRLDVVCFLLLRLARRRLPTDLQGPLHDEEWVPELHHILRREEARPITRLVQGVRYALGLLLKTGSVAAEIGDSRPAPNETPANEPITLEIHDARQSQVSGKASVHFGGGVKVQAPAAARPGAWRRRRAAAGAARSRRG